MVALFPLNQQNNYLLGVFSCDFKLSLLFHALKQLEQT